MENNDLLKEIVSKAHSWLTPFYDETTRKEVRRMLDNPDKTELTDSFYKNMEFGTGGLRGIMGAGTNRMNIYTVGATTQGLCNYLKRNFSHLAEIRVAIGHDCRNNSRLFAESCAGIFAANGIRALLFEDLRPTPELSFAIREYDQEPPDDRGLFRVEALRRESSVDLQSIPRPPPCRRV